MGKFDPGVILRLYPKGISQDIGKASNTKILTVVTCNIKINLGKIPQMSNSKLLCMNIRVTPSEEMQWHY